MWHYNETGSGQPLVLLHGIGMSHAAWAAVTPYLRATRRVIAFDTAGFGRTPPLPAHVPPSVGHLVDGLAQSLRQLGIHSPIDIAGNSLGGCLALEAARRGLARTVVAIAPMGLWKDHGARHVPYVFGALRFMAKHAPDLMRRTMRVALLREIALAVPLSTGSGRIPAGDAVRAVNDLEAAVGFEDTFDQTRAPFSARDITVPVTVAFGDRDWILTKGSQWREALPPHATWRRMPGWGHVPMPIDPAGVARLVLEGTR